MQEEGPPPAEIDPPTRVNRGLALGGLAVALLATIGLLRLTDGAEAPPPDLADTPDDVALPDREADESVPESSDIAIDAPIGSVVNLYPVGLPDDWSVTIFPFFASAEPFATLTLQPEDEDGVLGVFQNVLFEPGPDGDIRWTGDEMLSGWREWAGRGWMGRIDNQADDTYEDELDLLDALAAAGLLDDPAGDVPTGWRLSGDSRSSVQGNTIEIQAPDEGVIQMTSTLFEDGSYSQSAVEQKMREFMAQASDADLELTAGGFPGWDAGLGSVILYRDGWSYEIRTPEDLSAANRRTFLDSLRPVTITERSNLELLGLMGPGPDGDDHWHAVYAIYVCDQYLDPFATEDDPNGIHSHADGLIHIHPFNNAVRGSGATFATFLDAVGWDFEPGNIGARDGSVRFGDGSCGDVEMRTMLTYRAGTDRTSPPLVLEGDDMFDAFFPTDEGIWVLSHLPEPLRPPLIPAERVAQLELSTGRGD